MRECQQCGKNYEGNFCPYCGTKWMGEGERICPDCGETVAPGMRFCANCGYDFSKRSSREELKAEKQMQAAILRTEYFTETIPSMLRIGNAVLSLIFSALLWLFFSLPVTTILGESVGNLYQFMNGTTALGALLGKFSEITWVMLLAGAFSICAFAVLCISVAGRKEKRSYVKHCFYNLFLLAFHIVFFAIGCILRSKVANFGLTVGACATSLMICSAAFFVISLALTIPALVLSLKVPFTPEEYAEREARKALLVARAKKIAKPACVLGTLALIVVMIVSVSTNIFRSGKVDNIVIGDSKETVLSILGEPYEKTTETKRLYAEYVRADYDTVWKYYSKEYTDIFGRMDAVEGELDGADSILDVGGLVGIGGILGDALSTTGDALKLHYKYIEVAFKDGAVVAVYLDKDRTALEEEAGELKKKSEVSSLSFVPFEYTGCSGGGYGKTRLVAKYADGSYLNDFVRVEKKNYQLAWNDFKGEHTYSPNGSAWDGTQLGTLQHSVEAWTTVKAATCTEKGKKEGTCKYCGKVTEMIPATGHSGDWTLVYASTCTQAGKERLDSCTACGESSERSIPAGHQNQNGICSVCSVVLSLGDSTYIRVDAEGKKDAGGSYILFGEYPQALKAESVTVGITADSRGYYLGSDGFYYAKVMADPNNSGYTFSSGAKVTDGTVYYFKVEPIRWRILSDDGTNALILCDSIIANKRYDDSSNNYANSEIRAWLNEAFYNTTFNDLQKALVNTVTVDNSVESTGYSSNSYACENTSDKVFLLSYKEVTNADYGFSSSGQSDTARQMTVSDYARATGAYMSTSSSYYGNGYWWLRSPYYDLSTYARDVDYDGFVNDINSNVYYSKYGVVPALQIRLR